MDPQTLHYGIGLDLGQVHDYTALVVVAAVAVPTGEAETVTEDPADYAFRPVPMDRRGRPTAPRTYSRPVCRVEHHVVHVSAGGASPTRRSWTGPAPWSAR